MTTRLSTRSRWIRPLLLAGMAVAVWLSAAADANGYVYWANSSIPTLNGTTLGRANLDGTGVDQSFITGANGPCGVAVDSAHIYWGNDGAGVGTTLGRAAIDGSAVDQSFISGAARPCLPAVDSQFIYWTSAGATGVGRADLGGGGVNPIFVPTPGNFPCGVAVNSTNVYWGNGVQDSIGRATITGGSPDQNFIPDPTPDPSISEDPCGVAVNGAHIYWANLSTNTIGRANLDGSAANWSFITGASAPCGVAVDGEHIYWGNVVGGTIGRANLDGTGVDQSFITGAVGPCGVAVDSLIRPSTTSVACERTGSALNQPTVCTATVTDAGAAAGASPPAGTVDFASATSGSSFQGPSSCTLAAAGPDSSSCSVTYVPGSGTNLLQATYGGHAGAHDPGLGVGQLVVSDFALGSPVLNPAIGTATVTATLPGPGSVSVQGGGILPTSGTTASPGQLPLLLSPDATARSQLQQTGMATVSAAFNYVPLGGGAQASRSLTVTLLRNLPAQAQKKKAKCKRRQKGGKKKGCKRKGKRR